MIEKVLKRFAYVRSIEAAMAALDKENAGLKEMVTQQRAIIDRPEDLPELVCRAKARTLDYLFQVARSESAAYPGLARKIQTFLEMLGGELLAEHAYPPRKKKVAAGVQGSAA
jgi:hypothetical protein